MSISKIITLNRSDNFNNIEEFVLDSTEDYGNLPLTSPAGSTAYTADGKNKYRLSPSGVWKPVQTGGGGGGGGGDTTMFKVTFTRDETEGGEIIACDKTFEEINEALSKGLVCYGIIPESETLGMLQTFNVRRENNSSEIIFDFISDRAVISGISNSEDVVVSNVFEIAGVKDLPMEVVFNETGSSITCSKTYSELLTQLSGKGTVIVSQSINGAITGAKSSSVSCHEDSEGQMVFCFYFHNWSYEINKNNEIIKSVPSPV